MNDSYIGNMNDDDYQEAVILDEGGCSCPVGRKTSRPYVRIEDLDGNDDTVFLNIRPITKRYSRSEQTQETTIKGVRTGKQRVITTINGVTTTQDYDY